MSAASKSDLKARLLSAIVLAPIVIFLAWLGGYWFAGLMIFLSVIMFWEWTTITLRAIDIRRDTLAVICVILLLVYTILQPSVIPIIICAILVLAGWLVGRLFCRKSGWTIAGIGIVSSLAVSAILIRGNNETGLNELMFVCFIVWAADSAAYAVGRTVGGPKLMPKVSPKKTWSGFLGGVAGAMLIGLIVSETLLGWSWERVLLFSVLLAFAAQVGDLAESWVKRRFNVKDASNLIPGHGGVLDRVDGLTLAAYFFVAIHAIASVI